MLRWVLAKVAAMLHVAVCAGGGTCAAACCGGCKQKRLRCGMLRWVGAKEAARLRCCLLLWVQREVAALWRDAVGAGEGGCATFCGGGCKQRGLRCCMLR